MLNKGMNKYNTWYNLITENAKNRTIEGYTESHHVIPRSLGGSDDADNLVDLTAREHFICHWLLTKIYTGESRAKMIYALNGMKRNGQHTERYETKITSRVYENLKKEFAVIHSATMKGRDPWNRGYKEDRPDVLENVKQAALKRKPQSKESREKQAQKTRGQKRTEEQRENISKSLKGKLRGPMADYHREAISKGTTGKKKPAGHGAAISETVAKLIAEGTHYTQIKIQCPHCPVQASKARYNAYHGDKCRHKP
jgi:hypothetical protein